MYRDNISGTRITENDAHANNVQKQLRFRKTSYSILYPAPEMINTYAISYTRQLLYAFPMNRRCMKRNIAVKGVAFYKESNKRVIELYSIPKSNLLYESIY